MSYWDRYPSLDWMRTDAPDRRSPAEQRRDPRPYVVEGPNHVMHLLLSLFTFGLWLPVWLIVAAQNNKSVRYLDR